MRKSSFEIRKEIESNWNQYLSKYSDIFSSNSISGSSPPSVFVGSYGYPMVFAGPMVPPIHGDTKILDLPEIWSEKSFEEIINFRLNLIRGVKSVKITDIDERYIQNLQEVAMASKPIDSDLDFLKLSKIHTLDGENPLFGPLGTIKNVKFSNSSTNRKIQKIFYDKDMIAQESILKLFNDGIEISKIQKCLSLGMFGKKRKLVPTRWSITATDSIISKSLITEIKDFDFLDSCRVFTFNHFENFFSIILFQSCWLFELQEAWFDSQNNIGFGSDFEGSDGLNHYPTTAGAYYASRLGVTEYLWKNKIQSGALVLREIRPGYQIPLGVWQVREGVRKALKNNPIVFSKFEEGIDYACKQLSIDKNEWLVHSKLHKIKQQKAISDFF